MCVRSKNPTFAQSDKSVATAATPTTAVLLTAACCCMMICSRSLPVTAPAAVKGLYYSSMYVVCTAVPGAPEKDRCVRCAGTYIYRVVFVYYRSSLLGDPALVPCRLNTTAKF